MIDRRWYVVAAIFLACSVSYYVGKKQQSMDDALKVNADSIHVRDSVVRVDSSKVDSAKKTAAVIDTYRTRVREKVRVVHDTVYAADDCTQIGNDCTQDPEQVLSDNPVIAQLISADDSTIKALKTVIAAQGTEIADLRSTLKLRDGRISLLESDRTPGKLRKILTATRWIAVGAVIGAAFVHR